MLGALGARFDDDEGDLSAALARVAGVELVLTWDVDSPLLGEHGAARVFAPQKGATPEQVAELESRLARLARCTRPELADAPGAGAAGGLGFGALLLGARPVRGIDWLLDRVGFDARLDRADLVITAEGCLDEQSLRGKAVVGVAERALARGVPVVALAGAVTVAPDALRAQGLTAAFSLCPGPASTAEAMREARGWLTRVSEHVVALRACSGTAP
jgi:glycerate kinase